MKKRMIYMLAVSAMMVWLTACGKQSADTSGINPDDYVTLGDYSNLTAEYELKTVSEEDIDNQVDMELGYYIDSYNLYSYEPVTNRDEVQDGDMVNIDYVGKKDGVAFDGGTASGYYLEIGSGTFIPGFEEGLIGKKRGETVDLNLTFPETYHSDELAGADVVFTVTINEICDAEKVNTPAYDDELIARLSEFGFGFDSMDAYRENVRQYLERQLEKDNLAGRNGAVWEVVYATCEVKDPPQALVDRMKQRAYDSAQRYASQASVELNEFIENQMQMSAEEFEEMAQSSAVDSAKELLATYAIAKKEDIVVTQQDLSELKQAEAENAGQSVEDYFADIDDQDYYDYVLAQKVDEYLSGIVNIVEK